MSELPEVHRADCGHGFLPVGAPASAVINTGSSMQMLYLCDDCRARLKPKVETKDVKPEQAQQKRQDDHPKQEQQSERQVETKEAKRPATPEEEGAQAAKKGKTQADNPYDGRTKDGRDWQRGFAKAKGR